MKKISLLLISLFLILLFNQNTFAWCFTRKDITTKIKIKPNSECIDAHIIHNCISTINLSIWIKCENDYFLMNQQEEEIKFNTETNVTWYIKTYNDYTIPQDYSKWERKLINKTNPDDIIIIKWKNISIIEYRITLFVKIIFIILLFILYRKWMLKKIFIKIKNIVENIFNSTKS